MSKGRVFGRLGAVASLALIVWASPGAARSVGPKRSATALMREMEQSAATVRITLRKAREYGDVVSARCASNKLSEIHAQLRLAEAHSVHLRTPGDDPTRRHRYLLEVAHERARELSQEARRCGPGSESLVRVVRR